MEDRGSSFWSAGAEPAAAGGDTALTWRVEESAKRIKRGTRVDPKTPRRESAVASRMCGLCRRTPKGFAACGTHDHACPVLQVTHLTRHLPLISLLRPIHAGVILYLSF
jgi:hypothetical protein